MNTLRPFDSTLHQLGVLRPSPGLAGESRKILQYKPNWIPRSGHRWDRSLSAQHVRVGLLAGYTRLRYLAGLQACGGCHHTGEYSDAPCRLAAQHHFANESFQCRSCANNRFRSSRSRSLRRRRHTLLQQRSMRRISARPLQSPQTALGRSSRDCTYLRSAAISPSILQHPDCTHVSTCVSCWSGVWFPFIFAADCSCPKFRAGTRKSAPAEGGRRQCRPGAAGGLCYNTRLLCLHPRPHLLYFQAKSLYSDRPEPPSGCFWVAVATFQSKTIMQSSCSMHQADSL